MKTARILLLGTCSPILIGVSSTPALAQLPSNIEAYGPVCEAIKGSSTRDEIRIILEYFPTDENYKHQLVKQVSRQCDAYYEWDKERKSGPAYAQNFLSQPGIAQELETALRERITSVDELYKVNQNRENLQISRWGGLRYFNGVDIRRYGTAAQKEELNSVVERWANSEGIRFILDYIENARSDDLYRYYFNSDTLRQQFDIREFAHIPFNKTSLEAVDALMKARLPEFLDYMQTPRYRQEEEDRQAYGRRIHCKIYYCEENDLIGQLGSMIEAFVGSDFAQKAYQNRLPPPPNGARRLYCSRYGDAEAGARSCVGGTPDEHLDGIIKCLDSNTSTFDLKMWYYPDTKRCVEWGS